MRPILLCLLLALGVVGCTAATAAAGAASAIQSTLTVIRDVRSLVCTTKLDPLFGDPRSGEDTYEPTHGGPKDGGADAGDAGEADR